jgi:hypothetical protein
MGPKLRRKTAELEKRLADAVHKRDQRLKLLLREGPAYACRHATAVAAIALSGQPKIDEPLARAWARALRRYKIHRKDEDGAARRLHPIIVGSHDETSRFAEIFKGAPIWLLQFTGMALDARFLKFELPDISKEERWGSAGFRDAQRWPQLPVGTISAGDPIPELDPRRVAIMMNFIITVPFPTLEDLASRSKRGRAPEPIDEIELLEAALMSETRPDGCWSSYEKRRLRSLGNRIVRRTV